MAADLESDLRLASRIASRVLKETPSAVTPLVGRGSVNKVFVAEAAGRRVVVRMSDGGDALDEYRKESWCIRRADALGVPVPSVIAVGRRGANAYIVLSYVEGEEGREVPSAAPRVWRELGRYARLIHSVRVRGLGLRLSDITRGDSRESWLSHLDYNVESLNGRDPLIKLGVLTPRQSIIFKGVFADLKGRRFNFGLNHGDLSLKNTVVGAGGRVTLLDWGSAEAHVVPHHDLIEMLKMGMSEGDPDAAATRAFLEGYGMSAAEYGRMMPELESLLALRAFDKLRWAIDREVEPLDEYVRHARDAARRCLRLS